MPARPRSNSQRSNANGTRRSGQVAARVCDVLRERILRGELTAGTHLSQQALSQEMKTSNGPIISALRQLAYEGLVSHEPGNGCRVTNWSAERFEELLTVRRALETEAARLAARRAGPEDLDQLRAIVNRMADLVCQGRRQEADAVDAELHVAIARISRCQELIESFQRCHLVDLVRRRLKVNERYGDFTHLADNHRVLVEAIASGNPEQAGQAMHAHLSPRRQTVPGEEQKLNSR